MVSHPSAVNAAPESNACECGIEVLRGRLERGQDCNTERWVERQSQSAVSENAPSVQGEHVGKTERGHQRAMRFVLSYSE
jgi:hypothetical protein